MKEVKVLGPGCPKCAELYRRTEAAIERLGADCTLSKVEDINEIISHGVMLTPALVVDGAVKFSGKVPEGSELEGYLQ